MNTENHLYSNSNPIPFTKTYFEKMVPSSCQEGTALREKLKMDGYLYFPSFFNSENVFDIRERYFKLFDPIIFQEGTTPRQGVFSGVFEYSALEHGHEHHPAAKFVKSDEFEQFTKDQKLYDIASLLLESEVMQLKRKPLRHFYNKTRIASRAHIDHTYLEEGTKKLITAWIPIGDVDVHGGGLIYLKKSHTSDANTLRGMSSGTDRPNDTRPITNDLKKLSDVTGQPWLYANFKAGDIVVHSPFIVHASLDLESDVMRLSTDVRFCSADETIDARWSGHWRGNDGL